MGDQIVLGNRLRRLFGGSPDAPATRDTAPAETTPAPVFEETAPAAASGIPGEVVAAIAAAIASVWTGPTGFVVRRIRRVPKGRNNR